MPILGLSRIGDLRDPYRLCAFLLAKCYERGVALHFPAKVTGLRRATSTQKLEAVLLDDGTVLPADKIILTAGPWTSAVFDSLFPNSKKASRKLKVGALAGHSIVVRSPHWRGNPQARSTGNELGCHAVFATSFTASDAIAGDKTFAPVCMAFTHLRRMWLRVEQEIFSRHPDEIYIAGLNSSTARLPDKAEDSQIDPEAVSALKKAAEKMLRLRLPGNAQSEVEVVRAGHCFRPTTPTGRPVSQKLTH